MNSQVPTIFTAVGAFIAAVVAVIAFLQWNTAREKVLLDLFDKRFGVYYELLGVIGRHITTGIGQDDTFVFARAASRARFLFGSEVQTYLEARQEDLNRAMVERNSQPKEVPEEQVARANRLSNFTHDLNQLVAPYMSHHQMALSHSWIGWVRSIVGCVRG